MLEGNVRAVAEKRMHHKQVLTLKQEKEAES
jgi:hypothetical protein